MVEGIKKIGVFIVLFIIVFILANVSFAADPNISVVTDNRGDQVNPKITENNVAWSEFNNTNHKWDTYLKNLKTKKITKITYDKVSMKTYYSLAEHKYGNLRAVVEKSDKKDHNYQLSVYNTVTNNKKVLRYLKSAPFGLSFFGKYVVYSLAKSSSSKKTSASGMNLHLMNIVSIKDQIIYDVDYRFFNPTIYGQDIYWLEGTCIKRYNIKTKKYYIPFNNKKPILSKDVVYRSSISHFSVYENFLVFESVKNKDSDIHLINMPGIKSGVPKPSFTYKNLYPNKSVIFDGSSSYDSDGKIISYNWDFGDGSKANGPKVSYTYPVGYKNIILSVTDDEGVYKTINKKLEVFYPGKELLITNFTAQNSANKLIISNLVQNLGKASSGIFKVYFYVTPNKNLSGSKYLTSITVPSLGPASSYSQSIYIKPPSSIPSGSYYVAAVADGEKSVQEFDENNNISFSENQINVQKYYLNLGSEYLQLQLIIPKLGVKCYIRTDTVNAYNAAYHYPNSVIPGQPGECGFLAHRTTYSGLFRNINLLNKGDLVIVKDYLNQKNYYYKVTSNNEDIRWDYENNPMTFQTEGTSKVLLVTCYPPGRKDAESVTHCALYSIENFS